MGRCEHQETGGPRGAFSGYSDGSFKPDNNISRAEFATILVKAFQLAPQKGKVFADTAGHWASDFISTAVNNGIVNGYDADTFGPDDLVTREQMAVMAVKTARITMTSDKTAFTDDADISEWARSAVGTAVMTILLNPGAALPGGRFS